MTSPHPTPEAVEAATRAFHAAMSGVPAWDDLPPIAQHNMRQAILPLLTAAYPQIVADVLNHYADQLEDADDLTRVESPGWLRYQAREVQS